MARVAATVELKDVGVFFKALAAKSEAMTEDQKTKWFKHAIARMVDDAKMTPVVYATKKKPKK